MHDIVGGGRPEQQEYSYNHVTQVKVVERSPSLTLSKNRRNNQDTIGKGSQFMAGPSVLQPQNVSIIGGGVHSFQTKQMVPLHI